ncbi:MAG: SH3 domain-containing protein [Blastocatellia bacterium]|nr:SH3 domain-containing protein [Blastocatellia bacterium]
MIFIFAWLAAAKSSALGTIIQEQLEQPAKRITVVSNARLRTSPQTSAEEVIRLPLGTIVLTLDQSAEKEKIGGMEDFWYRVRTEDGKSGWLFGGLTANFLPASREEIYLSIAVERLKTARQDFFEQVDLYKFLTRAITEIKAPTIAAELELAQLLALSNSLRAIPRPREPQQPYASWLQVHEADIVYSEPAAMWLVKLEHFWELEKKYHSLPIGERIAWTAAHYELPGECEGDIPCLFAVMRMREGKYLELYPNGAHAAEIISQINELLRFINHDNQFLQNQMHSELSSEDRSKLKNAIAEFRKVIMEVTNSKKNALLKQIDQLSQAIP